MSLNFLLKRFLIRGPTRHFLPGTALFAVSGWMDLMLTGGDRRGGSPGSGMDDGASEDPGRRLLGFKRGLVGHLARLLLPAVYTKGRIACRQGVCAITVSISC